jgi:hypothetical protein
VITILVDSQYFWHFFLPHYGALWGTATKDMESD